MTRNKNITFSSLDPTQKKTFDDILSGEDNLHIVHGPPGTGKSQLVVSLLESIASRGKNVLFVSQNTEALKVIERMINKTEKTIGYPSSERYLSLLDFSLLLYKPEHRYLKYLREHYTRLSAKELPRFNNVEKSDPVDYILKYVHLDRAENIRDDNVEIGYDELLRYLLEYVKSPIAPESIKNLEDVDVRGLFNSLDNYKQREMFSEFNKPRRELDLISTDNQQITLPEIRSNITTILKTESSWMSSFRTKTSISMHDYTGELKEYINAADTLDIYRLSLEGKSAKSLNADLETFYNKISSLQARIDKSREQIKNLSNSLPVSISGVDTNVHPIELKQSSEALIEKNLSQVEKDCARMVALWKNIESKYPDITHTGVHDLWVTASRWVIGHLDEELSKSNLDEKLINNLTPNAIGQIDYDLKDFTELGTIKKKLSGVPDSIKNNLGLTSAKQVDEYVDTHGILLSLKGLFSSNTNSVGDIRKITLRPTSIAISRVDIKQPTNLTESINEFIEINEAVALFEKYGINIEDQSLTVKELHRLCLDTETISKLSKVNENRSAFLSNRLKDFVNAINISIEIKLLEQDIDTTKEELHSCVRNSHANNSKFLANSPTPDKHVGSALKALAYLKHKEEKIENLLDTVTVPETITRLEPSLSEFEKSIATMRQSGQFSDQLFTLNSNQTIKEWFESISVLSYYNNDTELMDFIKHNQIIQDVRKSLGPDNQDYISEILSNDISFNDFAARMVNVIVDGYFGRASMKTRQKITSKALLEGYEEYLLNQKATAYKDNLSSLVPKSLTASKELAKQEVLQQGGTSTMDKFRHNTKKIIETFPIVCATPRHVAMYLAANKGMFDFVIFDEASQLLPGQSIPSIYRAKKAIVIGDPHQMPPSMNIQIGSIQSDDEFDEPGESILDLLMKQPQKQHHLKVHYRSVYNKLFEPSREMIYQHDGIDPIFEADLANGAPIDILDDMGSGLDSYGYDKNFRKILDQVHEYLKINKEGTFCILFTTAMVLGKFKDFLSDVGEREYPQVSSLYNSDKILLSTVTDCQGIEGTYTIIYLHNYDRPGSMWFFNESAGAYKRLNVSITRQREGLTLLLANPKSHWIKACDSKINNSLVGPNALKSAKLMRSLLTNAGEQADVHYLDRTLGSNVESFDSPLTEALYARLREYYADILDKELKIYSEVGWNLVIPSSDSISANQRNVGFRIDLGIYSIKHRRFILGIEMDGAAYHSGFDKEHSDYTRQKVLESKGWRIYRIWSTNWISDTNREFERLVKEINNQIDQPSHEEAVAQA